MTSSFGNENFVASSSCRVGEWLALLQGTIPGFSGMYVDERSMHKSLSNLPLFLRPLRFKRRLLLSDY